jgi:hypothetical protein
VKPRPRKRVIISVRLCTVKTRPGTVRSVLMQCGACPARSRDLRSRATSDATGHVFAIWPRFPALVRSQLIGYVWDPVLPVGTVVPSRKTSTVSFIVVRRGESGPGAMARRAPRRWRRPPRGVRGSRDLPASRGAIDRHQRHALDRPRPCSGASSCRRGDRGWRRRSVTR